MCYLLLVFGFHCVVPEPFLLRLWNISKELTMSIITQLRYLPYGDCTILHLVQVLVNKVITGD